MTYGLIGETLGHSYSKIIHEALGRYEYRLFSLTPDAFEAFVRKRNFQGLNITIPYKKAVMPLCDRISPLAKEIGAVNTLYWEDGALWGTNTDYDGFLYAARAAGISFSGKKTLILGNGGTSLMARKAAADHGAREILITSRRGEAGCVSYEELATHRDIDIIVNTTPVGTYPNNGGCLIDLARFPGCSGVIDVIYNPLATELLHQAKERGIPCSNGLPMLVAQATAAAERFLGCGDFQQQNESIIRMLQEQIENLVVFGGGYEASEEWARAEAVRRGKIFSLLTDLSAAMDLGKEKGLLIYVPKGLPCSGEHLKLLMQNGRILRKKDE